MSPGDPSTAVTRRGLAVMAWVVLISLLTSVLVEQRGLRWVQGVVWPSDLYTFQQVERGPIDIAVLGSSRAAFGVVPTSLDRCLAQELGRPTRTVNLARAFTTAYAADLLDEALLSGPRQPKMLVLVIEAETFDEHNPHLSNNVATIAGLADVPEALGTVHDLGTLFAVPQPVARGPETLALYLSGRWDTKPWLRWLMLHHGGGLFCTGSDPCRDHNKALEASLKSWWTTVATNLLPQLGPQRFPDYQAGDGPVYRHAERLLARAEEQGVQVVLMELPRMPVFERGIPPQVEPAYRATLARLLERHPLPHHPASTEVWAGQRSFYLDAEHLTSSGAHRATKELCKQTIAPLMRAADAADLGE